MWKFSDDVPIYMQIVEKLEEKIVDGSYSPGAKLPSVRELASEVGINPNTIQKSFGILEEKGLVVTNGTSGRTVCEDEKIIQEMKSDLALTITDSFIVKMEALGLDAKEIQKYIRDYYKEG